MKPFRIDMEFKTPCVLQNDFYLDALISAAYAKEILKDDFYLGKKAGDMTITKKVLGNYLDTEYSVFKCSKLFIDDDKEATTFYTKRFEFNDADKIKMKSKSIDTGRGFTKNYHNHLQYRVSYRGTFYGVGNLDEIENLLNKNITHIGKKTSQGYGEISQINFSETKSFDWVQGGELVRNIPCEHYNHFRYKEDVVKIMCGYKAIVPPYWREEKVACFY
jgi:hypothetical protein